MYKLTLYFLLVLTTLCACKSPNSGSTVKSAEIPSADSKPNAANDDSSAVVSLFYGTNRRVDKMELHRHGKHYVNADKLNSLTKVFSGHRQFPLEGRDDPAADHNFYGVAEVNIPRVHRRGQLETATAKKFKSNEHIGLVNIWLYENPSEFDRNLSEVAQHTDNKDILVMIHGFNVTFHEAMEAYGTFVYDIEFKGIPAIYTWASDGVLSAYDDDEDTIRLSDVGFGKFMERIWALQAKTGGKVHILAHSMGNRLLLSYLYDRREDKRVAFENVIFAAPDVDGTEFIAKTVQARHLAKRLTLYVNEKDKALAASNFKHSWWRRFKYEVGLSDVGAANRAGYAGEKTVVTSQVDTIDLTPLKTGMLNHSDFASNPLVVEDISGLVNRYLSVVERTAIFQNLKAVETERDKGERILHDLPLVYHTFRMETPLVEVLPEKENGWKGQVVRLNSQNSLYLNVVRGGVTDPVPLQRQEQGRYVGYGRLLKDVELVPNLCRVFLSTTGRKSYDLVLAGKTDSFGCQQLKRMMVE